MRINKFIAQAGYTSRRKADDLIAAEKVKVNGKILKEMGYNVKDDDIISIDGKILQLEEYFYYKLNKPVGYITSNYDPHNEKDLNNLIDIDERFFAAGRLDKDSHGLLIITNDGDFTNALIHPSSGISKEYIVKVDKLLNQNQIEKFKSGLDIGNGELTSDAAIRYIKNNTYIVAIRQGYNRQIRRMFNVFDSTVIDLKRTRIGAIHLNDLIAGQYKKFDKKEMEFVSLMKE
ncbi:Ribosomal large subunit pseudouridine synthase B [Anaerococcus octavius]|uniref:Pseudouridine synthase n=1 Tax=Anaerococcus octavius TaxID=54007 RepID=A0A380WT55_9FIRM|nr:pseudouridine synthase [Anaerococcus octavius]SUU92138.1 Ribosomal large subunit pseudouridine synthase B [Anaerococcus octavius]